MIRLVHADEVDRLVDILANAYPRSMPSQVQRDEAVSEIRQGQDTPGRPKYYGVYRDGELQGGMELYDFRMNLAGTIVDAGGIGSVAVDLVHKKEHIAKELLEGFLTHYRNKGVSMAILYAFRTDFYARMGFGQGPQMFQYRLRPEQFAKGPSKAHIVRLTGTADDKQQLKHYYQRQVECTHGLIERTDREIDALFSTPATLVFGYRDDGRLKGYMTGKFRPEHPDNGLSNNLHVDELFYESPEVLDEFFTFLHSQADQCRHIVVATHDPDFYHLFGDSRDNSDAATHGGAYTMSSAAATGLMYRVTDPAALFRDLANRDFGGASLCIRFVLDDTFIPANSRPFTVRFGQGRAEWLGDATEVDGTVHMGIGAFSSLVMGVVPFRKLATYGLAKISDASLAPALERIFEIGEPPVCVTHF